jgi:hypothetical protein
MRNVDRLRRPSSCRPPPLLPRPSPRHGSPGTSAPAVSTETVPAETLYTAPRDVPMPFSPGVTRSLDLLYEPSVADSILPLVPLYREVMTDEVLSAYEGALRQDLPTRAYPCSSRTRPCTRRSTGRAGKATWRSC